MSVSPGAIAVAKSGRLLCGWGDGLEEFVNSCCTENYGREVRVMAITEDWYVGRVLDGENRRELLI